MNNRVLRLDTSNSDKTILHPDWVVGDDATRTDIFNSPHSFVFHSQTESLIVADRDNYRLVVLDAATGALKGHLHDWCPPPQPRPRACVLTATG